MCVKTEANRNMQEMPSKAGSPVMAVAPMKEEGLLNILFALQSGLGTGCKVTMQIAAAGSGTKHPFHEFKIYNCSP